MPFDLEHPYANEAVQRTARRIVADIIELSKAVSAYSRIYGIDRHARGAFEALDDLEIYRDHIIASMAM
jgi:hypothetical protein